MKRRRSDQFVARFWFNIARILGLVAVAASPLACGGDPEEMNPVGPNDPVASESGTASTEGALSPALPEAILVEVASRYPELEDELFSASSEGDIIAFAFANTWNGSDLQSVQCNSEGCRRLEYTSATDAEAPSAADEPDFVPVEVLLEAPNALSKVLGDGHPATGQRYSARGVTTLITVKRLTSQPPYLYKIHGFFNIDSYSNWNGEASDFTAVLWTGGFPRSSKAWSCTNVTGKSCAWQVEADYEPGKGSVVEFADSTSGWVSYYPAVWGLTDAVRLGSHDAVVTSKTRKSGFFDAAFKYVHTYGGYNYSVTVGLPPSITVTPTSSQWVVPVNVPWSM